MAGCLVGGGLYPILLSMAAVFTGELPSFTSFGVLMSTRVMGALGAIVMPLILRKYTNLLSEK